MLAVQEEQKQGGFSRNVGKSGKPPKSIVEEEQTGSKFSLFNESKEGFSREKFEFERQMLLQVELK